MMEIILGQTDLEHKHPNKIFLLRLIHGWQPNTQPAAHLIPSSGMGAENRTWLGENYF